MVIDRPNGEQQAKYDRFKTGYRCLFEEGRVFELPSFSLEEYYAPPFPKTAEESKLLGKQQQKVAYAKTIGALQGSVRIAHARSGWRREALLGARIQCQLDFMSMTGSALLPYPFCKARQLGRLHDLGYNPPRGLKQSGSTPALGCLRPFRTARIPQSIAHLCLNRGADQDSKHQAALVLILCEKSSQTTELSRSNGISRKTESP